MSTRNSINPKKSRFYQSSTLPKNHQYEEVALVLQGGGALGSYQAGVYQGLTEANLHPNWVAGISIGALNAAIIAGNAPERRVDKLLEFWQTICKQPIFPSIPSFALTKNKNLPPQWQGMLNVVEAWRALIEGQKGFFVPRATWSNLPTTPDNISFYSTKPLKSTLENLADFDRINDSEQMRISIGAVNVRTGNFTYFDNTKQQLTPEHFIASGSLPPGFPATEIDGEYYWDGGVVSNTPLMQVLETKPRKNTLIFQVDLWSSKGELPTSISEVMLRQKDIQYASRIKTIVSYMETMQKNRHLMRELLKLIPEKEFQKNSWYQQASKYACDRLYNVFHLIYQQKDCEGHYKDYQFGDQTMQIHWETGLHDIKTSLSRPKWLEMPSLEQPFVTHNIHNEQTS